ncbi:MAG: InlB B-repeat-containing protein [Paramuribaculum sp.]|nr:InlB B-repeat-containing protein [Paramuribaculum sp.]
MSITGYIEYNQSYSSSYAWHIVVLDEWVGEPPVEEVDLEVSSNPVDGGKVWIDSDESVTKSRIAPGSTHTISAEPNAGWSFLKWLLPNNEEKSNTVIEVTPSESAKYTAYFQKKAAPKYTLNVVASPDDAGSVTIAGCENTNIEVEENTEITVTATPAEGYDFNGWSDGTKVVSTSPTYTFPITANVTLTALFTPKPIVEEVTLKDILEGTAPLGKEVTLTGPFKVVCVEPATIYISNGTDVLKCDGLNNAEIYYPQGTVLEAVTVVPSKDDGSNENYSKLKRAVKSEGTTFDVGPVEFTLKNINEAFGKYVEIRNISLTRKSGLQDGYIMHCSEAGYSGLTHLLHTTNFSATEDIPYSKKWTIRGVITYINIGENASKNVFQPILIASSIVEQIGTEPELVTLSVKIGEGEGGKVWIDTDKEQITAKINLGSEHTISAEPLEDWEFVSWTLNDEVVGTEPVIKVSPSSSSTYIAHFSRKTISVSVAANPTDAGIVWLDEKDTQSKALTPGTEHTLYAEPLEGWEFVNWTLNDEVVGTEPIIKVSPSNSSTYIAHFFRKTISVSVAANPTDAGIVWLDEKDTQSKALTPGTEHTLYAEPQEEWEFVNWTFNGNVIGTDRAQKIIIEAAGEYIANFKELPETQKYTVNIIVNPAGGGAVTINGETAMSVELDESTEVSVIAHASEGYEFVEWRNGETVVSKLETYTFDLTESITLTAIFNYKEIKEEVTIKDILEGNVSLGEEISLVGPFKVICVEPGTIYISNGTDVIKCTGSEDSGLKYPVGTVIESLSLVPQVDEYSSESYATLKDVIPSAEKEIKVEPVRFDLNTIGEAFGKYIEIKDINLKKHPVLENGYVMTCPESDFEGKSFILRINQTQGGIDISEAQIWTIRGVITYCEIPVSRSGNIAPILVASDIVEQTQPSPEKIFLTVLPVPAEGGDAWIDEDEAQVNISVEIGSAHILHTRASEGWEFVKWMLGDIFVSSDEEITVSPQHASVYEAYFNKKSVAEKYSLTVSAVPEEGGTVAIVGTGGSTAEFEGGTEVSVVATPAEGYEFSGWSDGNKVISISPTYTFTIEANVTLTADFTAHPVVKEVTLKDILEGTAPLGEEVTLTGPFKVVCVEFATIYISNGTDVLKCYGLNNAEINYPQGTVLESVTVVPRKDKDSNENFSDLRKAVKSEESTLDVEPIEFTLKNINEAFGKYVEIRNISLTHHSWMQDGYVMHCAEPGYSGLTHLLYTTDFSGTEDIPYLKKWTIRGVITYYNVGKDPSENVFEPVLVASYIKEQAGSEPEKYNVTLTVNPAGSGKVWIGDNQETMMKSFNAGSQVTIHALPAAGMVFKSWQQASKVIATTPDYTITVSDNISLAANFAVAPPVKRIIKFSSADNSKGMVTVDGYEEDGQIEVAGPVTLRAVSVSPEHTFSHWTKNGERIQGGAVLTYSDSEDAEFVAYFTSSYAVTFTSPVNGTLNVTSSDGAPIQSGNKVDEGATIIIQLVPSDGYRVSSISANGVEISHTADPVEYIVTSPVVISGKVEAKAAGTHAVSVISSNPDLGAAYIGSPGITSVSLTYPDVAELHAEPAFGCKFEGWRLVNTTNFISTNPVYTVETPIRDAHYEAVFNYIIQTPRTITVVPSSPKKGTVRIKGESGTTVTTQRYLTLIATPFTENDRFIDWTDESNTVLSTNQEFVYDKEAGGIITANFKSSYTVRYSAEGPGSLLLLADGSPVLSGPSLSSSILLPENTRLSLKLMPAEHHEIAEIVINGKDVAKEYIDDEETYNMVLTEHLDIKVTFAPVHYKITINGSPHGTVAIFREIDSNGQGVGSSLVDQDRARYASSIYIFAKPLGDYRLESVRINGESRQPEQDKEYLLHKVEGDVTIEPVFAAVTGIDAVLSPDMEDEIEMVYDLSGRPLGKKLPARKGIYLVKIGTRVMKIKI